jgi:hypothetical protein
LNASLGKVFAVIPVHVCLLRIVWTCDVVTAGVGSDVGAVVGDDVGVVLGTAVGVVGEYEE